MMMIRRYPLNVISGSTTTTVINNLEPYPLGEYGFIAATETLALFGFPKGTVFPSAEQSLTSWHVRMSIPPNTDINGVGILVSVAGAVGAGGLNAFAVYSDDGQQLLGSTATDNTLFSASGWQIRTLTSPITGQSSTGFVRVLLAINGYSTSPAVSFAAVGPSSGEAFNTGYNKPNHRRSAAVTSLTTFPGTFTPSSYGIASKLLPPIVLV